MANTNDTLKCYRATVANKWIGRASQTSPGSLENIKFTLY